MVATALFIDFTVFLAPSNLSWPAKWMIVGLVSLGQLVSIWSWFHMKPWPKKIKEVQEKQVYDLTMKLPWEASSLSSFSFFCFLL